MTTIYYDSEKMKYNKENKTFDISEKNTGGFDTSYTLVNPKNNAKKVFEFSHSTGPEFDPNTKWIYKSDELILSVSNDKNITKISEQNYLRAKLRN